MKYLMILAEAGEEVQSVEMGAESANETGQATTSADGTTTGETGTETPERTPANQIMSFLPFILLFVVIYFFLFRGPKKKQQQQKQMIQNLGKNDRIRTVGGIIGTVLDVKDDELTIKIDESNNTKMKIVPNAVASVINNEIQN